MTHAAEVMSKEPTGWRQRLFSLKALHGLMMTIAWYQMLGRAMVTDPGNPGGSGHSKHPFTCWTYPAAKMLNADGSIDLVPADDPEFAFANGETQFAVAVTVPSIIFFILVGIAWSCIASRRQAAHLQHCQNNCNLDQTNKQQNNIDTNNTNSSNVNRITTASADDEMETTDET